MCIEEPCDRYADYNVNLFGGLALCEEHVGKYFIIADEEDDKKRVGEKDPFHYKILFHYSSTVTDSPSLSVQATNSNESKISCIGGVMTAEILASFPSAVGVGV